MKMVEQFKRRILDLAIRGKLVPQDPNDESASVLLERIREERAELVKAGKIKKDKQPSRIVIGSDGAAYEKFGDGVLLAAKNAKDARTGRVVHPHVAESGRAALVAAVEVPFNLPDGWAWARLDTLCQSIADGDHQAPPQTQTGIPFLVISNVSDGELNFTNTRFVGDDYYESLLPARIPSQGNILVTVTGSYGIVVRVDTDKPFCFQRHMALIKCCGECTDYLFNALQCVVIKRYFDTIATGTAQKTIALNHLRKTLIPLPPLAEQKRIVAKIAELFAVAGALGTAAEGLGNAARRLDRKILDLAIRGKLVPQNPDDEPASELLKRMSSSSHKSPCKNQSEPIDPPFVIPQSWEWVRLNELGVFCGGHTPSTSNPKLWGGDILWVSSKDMKSKYIDDTQIKVTRLGAEELNVLKPGTLLMCTRSGILRRVFPVAIARRELTINQDQRALTLWLPEMIEYVYLTLKSLEPIILSDYKKSGTTVESIIWNKFVDLPIPLPPLNEQKRIVKRVEELKATTRTLVTF